MKKMTLFVTLSLLIIAAPAFGQNLIGTWNVSYSDAISGGTTGTAGFAEIIDEVIVIDDQHSGTYGTLFHGHIEHGPGDIGYFSGVLDDNNNISFTHWDSVTRGKLIYKKNKPMRIEFINNAFDAENRSAKTAIGEAIKRP